MKVDISGKDIKSLKDVDWDKYRNEPITLDCSNNQLTSLEGCPSSVTKLDCSFNNLKSLKGCPANIKRLVCSGNYLKSLEGCPSSVTKLNCSYNELTSLQGCPNSVTFIDCCDNQLTSMKGCPSTISELYCQDNDIPRGEDTIEYVKILNFKKGIDTINKLIANNVQKTIKRVWERYWYEPNEQGEIRFAKYAYSN